MIATLSEIKALLGITSTTNDTRIESNIPLIEQAICNHCRNDFIDKRNGVFTVKVYGTITVSESAKTIELPTSHDFIAGDDIRIYGSIRNDGAYRIDSVNSNTLTIDSVYSLKDDESVALVLKVNYPIDLKTIVANIVSYNINDKIDKTMKTEKIDDYSYTMSDNINGYPSSLTNGLNNYRKLYKEDYSNYYLI